MNMKSKHEQENLDFIAGGCLSLNNGKWNVNLFMGI